MYIEHKEYLALLDEIDYLRKDVNMLKDENAILAEEVMRQRQMRHKLEQNHARNMRLIEELNAQAILNQKDNKNQIISKMTEITKQNKDFLEGKFTSLQKSALTKLETMELQNAKTKVGFYELTEFANKVRGLYKETLGAQNFKGKKQPTLMDLLKWIKCLPGVAINLTKNGFSSTMGSMSMSHIKKPNLRKSKINDMHSTLNSTQSKSRIKF